MNECSIWQVSAGSSDRSYVNQFLKYGVALIGPGDIGPWMPGQTDKDSDDNFIHRFAEEMQIGDILLLRVGQSAISAVGLIASEYQYLTQFDDVNGWDLQHARRVRWCPLPALYDFGRPVFGANPSRLSRVFVSDLVDYANRFVRSPPTEWQTNKLPNLPIENPKMEMPPADLQGIITQIQRLSQIYYRNDFDKWPTEDELIAHCVIPFLRTLGWPSEMIGVKWRNIDVCVFSALPRSPDSCYYLIEAKSLGTGIEGALEQAKRYVSTLGVTRDVITTDGIRYQMYSANKDFAPTAYANLTRLKLPAKKLFDRMRRPQPEK